MNHEASELAALRLAPVQCSYIGHPQTSGYPTIDYFLSGELIEPPDGRAALHGKAREAAQHRLPLRAAGACAGGGDARGAGAAPERDRLLVRAIAVQISAAARRGVSAHRARSRRLPVRVHPAFRHASVTELFQQRLDRAFAAAGLKAADHCVFLQRHGHEPLRRGERAMRRHARQHRLVRRQHHARGAGAGPAGRHVPGRADARPGQRRHAAHDGHARDDRRNASTITSRSRSAWAGTQPGGRSSSSASRATSTGSTATAPASPRWRTSSIARRARRLKPAAAAASSQISRSVKRPDCPAVFRFHAIGRTTTRACGARGKSWLAFRIFSWLAKTENGSRANASVSIRTRATC